MQLTDGAGATLLMTRREARRRGLPILGVFRSFAVVGFAGEAVPTPEAEPNLQGSVGIRSGSTISYDLIEQHFEAQSR